MVLKNSRMFIHRFALFVLAVGLLSACATRSPIAAESGADEVPLAVDEQGIAALYERIGQSTSDFQGGLELIRAGSPRAGREALDAALGTLQSAANECARKPGCESHRFVAAFAVLIRLQGVAAGWEPAAQNSGVDSQTEESIAIAPLLSANSVPRSTGHHKDLRSQIVLNEPVRAALEDWLTWMRPQLIETWINYAYLRPQMWPAYERAGLPEALLFGILAKESAGRVHSYSRAGAAGPLQFMPATAQRFGIGLVNGRDGRLDPAAAARANVSYLQEQFQVFNGNLELSLAAYNGGEGRMRRLAKQHPGKGFWSDRIFFALPVETRDYVPKVIAAAYLFMHPAEYGLSFPDVPAAIALEPLTASASLGEIAMCFGQDQRADGWFRTLRNLNPAIASEQRIPAGTRVRMPQSLVSVYQQRCGQTAQYARFSALQNARYPEGPMQVGYAVRRGDTLHAIARRTRCASVEEIAKLNNLKAPQYTLSVGQQIRLPTCS